MRNAYLAVMSTETVK